MPTANIQGHVSDPFGFPIPGAKVKVLSEDRTGQFQGIANKQGAYNINNLPAGQYKVLVSSLGFATEERNIRVWDGDQVVLDVGLNPGGADLPSIEVSGTVRQPDNAPLEDATITIANAFNQRLVQKVRTDKEGHYTVSVDTPGQYIVSASKAGFMVSAVVKVLPATLPRKRFEANFMLTLLRLP
jgi:protocatechuate 3,4-dioxygenase beta subunit